jgi:hypothetical protein
MKISPEELITIFSAIQKAEEFKHARGVKLNAHQDNLNLVAMVQAARNFRYVLSSFPAPGDFPSEPLEGGFDVDASRVHDMWKIAHDKHSELIGLQTQLVSAVEQMEKAIENLGISPRV